DVSGGVMSRPVLDRFLEEIKARRAQGLIVAKLDRFSRSSRGALNTLAEIEEAGGVLISVQEQIDSTTAAGKFVRAIFLATAEWERERIGESWLSAKTSAVARGVHNAREEREQSPLRPRPLRVLRLCDAPTEGARNDRSRVSLYDDHRARAVSRSVNNQRSAGGGIRT